MNANLSKDIILKVDSLNEEYSCNLDIVWNNNNECFFTSENFTSETYDLKNALLFLNDLESLIRINCHL